MTTVISAELQSKMATWRQKCTDGTITLPEMREAILAMRQDRLAAGQAASSGSRKQPTRSADDLLSELL